MTTIFVSVQTGMVVRDLLRGGVLDHVLGHPDARLVLLTPGVRVPAFVEGFGSARVSVVAQQAYAPSTMVLMGPAERSWGPLQPGLASRTPPEPHPFGREATKSATKLMVAFSCFHDWPSCCR